jgi:short-subunit dehydrogenase
MTENKYCLITGATSGIGYELAKLFADDGYNLVIAARNQKELTTSASEFKLRGVDVIPIVKDLFERNAAFELFDEIQNKGITIDVLVNDAGQGQYGEFTDTDISRELDIIQLNIASLVILTKKFLQQMVARGEGKILNLSSVASKIPGPLQSVYHGTKAFVQSFTEAVREEVKEKGVTITALLPGATATDFFNKAEMLEAKNIKGKELDDPAKVARDGYEALMRGDDMVISGFANKMQVGMSHVLSDSAVASNVHKKQAPSNEKKS